MSHSWTRGLPERWLGGFFRDRLQRHPVPLAWLALISLLMGSQALHAGELLLIEGQDGARHRFSVEVARTPRQQMQGLMGRQNLLPDQGMLFYLNPSRPVSMWMKDTPLSLDMLFVADDGRILAIHPRATPFSTRYIPSPGPVRGVLEVLAGTVARLGIGAGDRVTHPLFKLPPGP